MKSLTLICFATLVLTAFSTGTAKVTFKKSSDREFVFFTHGGTLGCAVALLDYVTMYNADSDKKVSFTGPTKSVVQSDVELPTLSGITTVADGTINDLCVITSELKDGVNAYAVHDTKRLVVRAARQLVL